MKFILTLVGLFINWSLSASSQSHPLTIPQGVLLSSGVNPHFVAKFALFLALLLLGTIAAGKFFKKLFRLPVIAGQIIGGVLLGPSLINIQGWYIFSEPLQMIDEVTGKFYALASSDLFVFFVVLISSALTVSYLLWIAGHETDIRDIAKLGGTVITAGTLGAVLPIAMTALLAFYFLDGYTLIEAVGLGVIFSATSVSIPVAMLFAQKKMHLRSSKAALGAAIIDDIIAVILLSVFFICVQAGMLGDVAGVLDGVHGSDVVEAMVYMLVSFAVIFFTGYWLIPPVIRFLKERHYSHLIASVANGAMLLYFAFAELVGGLAGITGAYFAGLFHRMGDHKHHAEKTISPFVNSFLLPLFLGSIGLQLNITILTADQWGVVMVLLVIAIISKLIGCFFSNMLSNCMIKDKNQKWIFWESYLFGSSMVARGEVGLVVATILRGAHIMNSEQYVIAVIVIVLTTIAAPIMLSIGFAQLDRVMPIKSKSKAYSLNLGLFNTIGTTQMFNIIIGRIEASQSFKTSIQMSEGRKIVNVLGHKVKIILCPDEGIILRGNREIIERILTIVQSSVLNDMESLSVAQS